MFKIFGNGYFVIVLSFDNKFLIPIIIADICFLDLLEFISAKVIDTCTLKMYLNPYQFYQSINGYIYLSIVSYVSGIALKSKATVLKKNVNLSENQTVGRKFFILIWKVNRFK